MSARKPTNCSTPSIQAKTSTPSRLSASTAEVIPVELSAETFERCPLPARIQGRVINPQHKLKITSLHDAKASCSCGWSLVHTGKLTRAEIRAKWWSHKRAVAALTFCIIPGCTGTKLEGRKYCAAHQERANGQTLAEKVTEQRHAHASRAEERVCEAEQEAIANGDAQPSLRLEGQLSPQECATVLHGLRLIQCEGRIEGCAAGDCEHFEDHEALSNAEIDTLAERINLGWINSTVDRMTAQAQESKTWTPQQLAAIQPQERQNIITALRAVAVVIAELWDTLRDVEQEHACEIELEEDFLSELAGDCQTPPSFSDLPEANVWERFAQRSHTDLTYYTAPEGESDIERDRR